MQRKACYSKYRILLFVLFIKPKSTKIFAIIDFQVFLTVHISWWSRFISFLSVSHILRDSDLLNLYSILYGSWDIRNIIYLFLTVCDNSLMTFIEKK